MTKMRIPHMSRRLLAKAAGVIRSRRPLLHRPTSISYRGRDEKVLQCCIAYNDHGGYCVPWSSHHRPASQRVLAGKVYEPRTIDFIVRNAGSGDIVHAGAYFGDFLPALSRACAEGARLWAFEPNPENYRCASITVALNGLDNLYLMPAALGARDGPSHLQITDARMKALGGGSRLVDQHAIDGRTRVVTVHVVRLDDVYPSDRGLSILQLDVEGAEQPALTGAMGTIRRCQPILFLESLPEPAWLSENLHPLGYIEAATIDGNSVLAVSARL
jgi:FkbM family methyltransferase